MADQIAVLAAPGRLIAADTPVALKYSKGDGYSVHIHTSAGFPQTKATLLQRIQSIHPAATYSTDAGRSIFHLHSKSTSQVSQVLRLVEDSKQELGIISYDAVGTSIEDIFLDLLEKEEVAADSEKPPTAGAFSQLQLSDGRARSPWGQATTIFYKRCLVMRRSWLGLFLALAVGISGAWWPIRFVTGPVTQCGRVEFPADFSSPVWPPYLSNSSIFVTPPSSVDALSAALPETRNTTARYFGSIMPLFPFEAIPDEATFNETVQDIVGNFTFTAGLSLNLEKNDYLVIWNLETGNTNAFSLVSNFFFTRALSPSNATTVTRMVPSFARLPSLPEESLLTLQWIAIFGAAMVSSFRLLLLV